MCRQPLPPSLSPPSAKLMIMALEEYGLPTRFNLSRRGELVDSHLFLFVMLLWRHSACFSSMLTCSVDLRKILSLVGFDWPGDLVFLELGCLVPYPFGFLPSQVYFRKECFLMFMVADLEAFESVGPFDTSLLIVRHFDDIVS
ncbi:hypothetical protein Tco_0397910 [Tanacetum coccineum]